MWDCAHSQPVGFCRPAGRHHQQASRDKAHQRPSHEPDRRRCFYNRAISRNQWLSEGPTGPPGLLFRSDFPSPGEGSLEWLHESQAGWCHPRGTALGHWPIRRQEFMSDCRPVAHSSPVLCRVPRHGLQSVPRHPLQFRWRRFFQQPAIVDCWLPTLRTRTLSNAPAMLQPKITIQVPRRRSLKALRTESQSEDYVAHIPASG